MAILKPSIDKKLVESMRASTEVLENDVEMAEDVDMASSPPQVSQPAQAALTTRSEPLGVGAMLEALEASGMGGLEVGFNSFPNIGLKDEFNISTGGTLPSSGFDVLVMGSRAKYGIKSTHSGDDESEIIFIYDMGDLRDQESEAAMKVKDWKNQGVGYQIKKYLEIWAFMVDDRSDAGLNGELCVLSVSPTSVQRFAGYSINTGLSKRVSVQKVVTRVSRGAKIGSGLKAFYPWEFEMVRLATEEEISGATFSN